MQSPIILNTCRLQVHAMFKDFHFKIYSSILTAAHINNTTRTDPKISMLDCNILCLVRSFHDSGKECYMTNEQLAKIFLTSERTIKSALNRLYWRGFIKSQGTKKRILVYDAEEVEKFVQEMFI